MTLLNLLMLSTILFCIGVYGLLTRRNIIGILMSVEIILNAAVINVIGFAYFLGRDAVSASAFAVFIIAVAACEMAVALAIVVALHRRRKSVDIQELKDLSG